MWTMSQMVGASYRCRGISSRKARVRDCRRPVLYCRRRPIGRSAVYRTVETIDLWPRWRWIDRVSRPHSLTCSRTCGARRGC